MYGQEYSGFWKYVEGSAHEGLHTFGLPSFKSSETVMLPHRILKPNTALWYIKRVKVVTDHCLEVKADDGAQLWQDGRRVIAEKSGLFCISAKRDSSEIIIRVLNNAMKGGLVSVSQNHQAENNHIPLPILPSFNTGDIKLPRDHQGNDQTKVQFWGDSQGGWTVFEKICRLMTSEVADANIGLGDLVAKGNDINEWHRFISCVLPVAQTRPTFLIAGNHDYDGYTDSLQAKYYLQMYRQGNGLPYYWFRVKNIAFLALDPNQNFPLGFDEAQKSWADSVYELNEWKTASWKILLVHQVPYGAGWAGYEGESFIREYVDAVIEKSEFNIILGGHIHDYERVVKQIDGKSVLCIVSGGAGGGLEPAENDNTWKMDKIIKEHHYGTLSFEENDCTLIVKNLEGMIIDCTKFTKK